MTTSAKAPRGASRGTQASKISQGEQASIQPTAEPDLVPPLQETHISPAGQAISEIRRLRLYLEEQFPHEVDLTNRQVPETTVETAIRLLRGLSATAPPQQVKRCPEEYCNQISGHEGVHRWTHYQ